MLALICLMLFLMVPAGALAEAGGHSIPPHIGANAPRHADAAREHDQDARDHGTSKHDRQRPAISPEQAAQRARDRFGGRVLNVVLEHGPGGPYYRVKLLEHGRVRVVDIDARR